MSAVLQLPVWEINTFEAAWPTWGSRRERRLAIRAEAAAQRRLQRPPANMAFYRRHTESLLRRYLYASMQVGRAPSVLSDPVGRGWASSRPVRTFEDAVIFVLDIERCLEKLESFDRELLSRVVLQEYTQAEAAALLGMSVRTISNRFPLALDRLTEKVLEAGLLLLPQP
jgi:DNA-directed RNA polymerase specialized sigma24 family protein